MTTTGAEIRRGGTRGEGNRAQPFHSPSPPRRRPNAPQRDAVTPSSLVEPVAMDRYLDTLESTLMCIAQRRNMTIDQVDRYGRLLQNAAIDALGRDV